jgi:hypothetical protein
VLVEASNLDEIIIRFYGEGKGMNKALAFAALDFRLIKPYIKSMLLFPVLGVILSISLKSTYSGNVFHGGAAAHDILPLTIGEKNGLDILYGTLPLAAGPSCSGDICLCCTGDSPCPSGLLCSCFFRSWLVQPGSSLKKWR